MPKGTIYEYRCIKCGETFDFRNDPNDNKLAPCPYCGETGERVYTMPAVTWKDWTQDDLNSESMRRSHDHHYREINTVRR